MFKYEPISVYTECVAKVTLDAAFKVHRLLGPGLLESVYEICFIHELKRRGLSVRRQVFLPVIYDGIRLDSGLRLDMLVEDQLVVEIKAVETLIPLFEAQLLTYLKLIKRRLGFLINFNAPLLKDGIKRITL